MHSFFTVHIHQRLPLMADNEFHLLRQGCKKHKFLSVINEEKAKKKKPKKKVTCKMLSKNKKEKTRTVHLVLLSAYPLNSIPSTWACWAALNLQFKTVKHIKKKEHQQEKFTDT